MAKKHTKAEVQEKPRVEPSASEPTVIRANLNRQVTPSPGFVSLYTNDTQVQISPWDIRLIFGVITQPPGADLASISITTVGEVRMSPQHAKRVTMILLQQLKLY